MAVWPLVFLGLMAAGLMGSALTAADSSEGRINAVATMLVEQPAGFGRPIGDRAAWEEMASHESYQGIIPRAERMLGEPIPDQPDDLYLDYSRTGNRTRWERVAGRRRGRIRYLVLAECLENEGRFLPAIEETVQALCAESTWTLPAHDVSLANFRGERVDIDLASSALGWNLATADYLLGDRLGADTRQLIRDNVRRRVLDPYRDMVTGERKVNWWMRTTNNWNSVCLAGVTGAALAMVESRAERAFFVVAAEQYVQNFLHGFTADGYCSEGVGYWNYGFGHYVLLAEAISQATRGGVDLLGGDDILAPATYGPRIEIINDLYPAFADCGVGAKPSARVLHFISRRFRLGMREYEDTDMVSAGGSLAQAMMYSFPNSATQVPPADVAAEGPGLRSWFSDAGVLICRPGTDSACRIGVALKGGHNAEHHNHNDVGSFVVVVGQQAVLLDPGSEVYTARTFSAQRYESTVLNSYGHPVPMVAGQLQRTGKQARAEVIRTESTDDADTLVLDVRSAYDVAALTKLQRTFVYSRQGAGSLTVTDEVAFEEPQEFGTALITFGRWKQLGPTSLLVYDTEEAVRVDIQVEGSPFSIQSEELQEDVRSNAPPVRIGIELTRPVTAATVTTVITPVEPGGPLLRNGAFEEGSWAWRIPKDGMGSLSNDHAASGRTSLRILDSSKTHGSNIHSARVPVEGVRAFELRGKVLPISGDGVGVYVKYLDKDNRLLNETTSELGAIPSLMSLGGSSRQWEPFAVRCQAPEGTAYLRVWIHSYSTAVVEAYLDDLEIVPLDAG